MTYEPNIPLSNDKISQSQVDLLQNFQQLNTRFGQDHVSFSTGTNSGFHKQVTIPAVLPGDPVIATPGGVFYTKDVTGVTQAFFRNQTTVTQLTGLPQDLVSNGSITFGAGLILKWGFQASNGTKLLPVVFTTAFPANVFSIQVTGILNDDTQKTFSVKQGTPSTTGFTAQLSATAYFGIYWFAIGN